MAWEAGWPCIAEGAESKTMGMACIGSAGVEAVTEAVTAGSPFPEEMEMGIFSLEVQPGGELNSTGVDSMVAHLLEDEGPAATSVSRSWGPAAIETPCSISGGPQNCTGAGVLSPVVLFDLP